MSCNATPFCRITVLNPSTATCSIAIHSICMGRMCLSGDLFLLNVQQKQIVQAGQEMYLQIKKSIPQGYSRIVRHGVSSYLHPKGYQIFARYAKESAYLVIHGFENAPSSIEYKLEGNWKIGQVFKQNHINLSLKAQVLSLSGVEDFNGLVIELIPKL